VNFLRTMSGAFATAIITFFWHDSTVHNREYLVNSLNAPDHTLSLLQRAGQTAGQALLSFSNMIDTQSTMLATNNVFFFVSLILTAVAAGVWLMPKPKGPATMASGNH
jgi:MFS transporter, DHA2 family, multidrug resistance protein